MKRNTLMLCIVLPALGAAACGCGMGEKQPDQRRFFMLEAARPGQAPPPGTGHLIAVKRFAMSSRFREKELVYRTGEVAYESDYYNQFLTSASTMIAEQTRRWLSEAGLFAAVINTGSDVLPTHIIEGNVTRLYGDVRGEGAGKAVMAVEFFVLDVAGDEPKVIFHGEYAAEGPFEPPLSGEGLVKVYNVGLGKVLAAFEKDLRSLFTSPPGAP